MFKRRSELRCEVQKFIIEIRMPFVTQSLKLVRAQNSGRPTVSVRPKLPVERSLYNLPSHVGRGYI